MKKYLLTTFTILALDAAVSGYVSPAAADVVYVTVTGTVSGTDTGGLFGTAGADLTGDAYTAQYEFDTSLGYTYSSAYQDYAYGGSADSAASPSLGASLTINNQLFSIPGAYFSEIYGYNVGYYSESYVVAGSNGSDLQEEFYGLPGTSPGSITTAFTANAIDNPYQYGYFDDSSTLTSLYLIFSTYTEATSVAVPEPASMALLGVGLATLGWVRRKRA